MASMADGTGPGGHPGVTVIDLSGGPANVQTALQAVYAAGADFAFTYNDDGVPFAVFVTKYPGR